MYIIHNYFNCRLVQKSIKSEMIYIKFYIRSYERFCTLLQAVLVDGLSNVALCNIIQAVEGKANLTKSHLIMIIRF